ncbi:MAG: hypothetical protein ACLTTJ_08235 [Blautia sp.]
MMHRQTKGQRLVEVILCILEVPQEMPEIELNGNRVIKKEYSVKKYIARIVVMLLIASVLPLRSICSRKGKY